MIARLSGLCAAILSIAVALPAAHAADTARDKLITALGTPLVVRCRLKFFDSSYPHDKSPDEQTCAFLRTQFWADYRQAMVGNVAAQWQIYHYMHVGGGFYGVLYNPALGCAFRLLAYPNWPADDLPKPSPASYARCVAMPGAKLMAIGLKAEIDALTKIPNAH